MASTTVTVKIENGKSPSGITISLSKDGVKIPPVISSPVSFGHTFDNLGSGEYTVSIAAILPPGIGKGTCSITTDEIVLWDTSDDNPCEISGEALIVQYQFTVA